jgi:hypothetical protein
VLPKIIEIKIPGLTLCQAVIRVCKNEQKLGALLKQDACRTVVTQCPGRSDAQEFQEQKEREEEFTPK